MNIQNHPSTGYGSKLLFLVSIPVFLLLTFTSCSNDNHNLAEEYVKDKEIDSTLAIQTIKYFRMTTPSSTSAQGAKLENPPSVDFKLPELQRYLAYLESNGATGIRLYFGRYQTNHPTESECSSCDYTGFSTMIFVGTKRINNVDDQDMFGIVDGKLFNAYNAGVSCPPLPATRCRGRYLEARTHP